ncbi:DUF7537 family lipoprotein [Halobacterium litoreum]|uniref:Uncharacterized protein n=1 Tax=Halobacterium litoreum TaxID=2039234 RepID=A0ABD5NCD9_9EURY|nr:hypothetical protein [Halobacterium litoreum]UHH14459.1 hypothetical protein LT972_05535 [Halobacterium litoreum]
MNRRFLAVAVAFLTVLAGCSGALSGSPGDGGADSPELAEQSWSDGESVDFDALITEHRAVVSNATSVERHAVVSSGGQGETTVSFAANRDTERAFLSISSSVRNRTQIQETFVADGQLYAKSGTAENPQYANQSFDQNFSRFVDQQTVLTVNGTIIEQWDFAYQGYEDGAFVFEADSVTPDPDAPEGGLDVANVTETSATLRVTERGVVRELSVSATLERNGETTEILSVAEYGGLNETTVETPDWVDEA